MNKVFENSHDKVAFCGRYPHINSKPVELLEHLSCIFDYHLILTNVFLWVMELGSWVRVILVNESKCIAEFVYLRGELSKAFHEFYKGLRIFHTSNKYYQAWLIFKIANFNQKVQCSYYVRNNAWCECWLPESIFR